MKKKSISKIFFCRINNFVVVVVVVFISTKKHTHTHKTHTFKNLCLIGAGNIINKRGLKTIPQTHQDLNKINYYPHLIDNKYNITWISIQISLQISRPYLPVLTYLLKIKTKSKP